MNNQLFAKTLYSNQLASKEQIQAHWAKVDDSKDIGQVLVESGIITQETYQQVLVFVQRLESQSPVSTEPAPATTNTPNPATATKPNPVPSAQPTAASIPNSIANSNSTIPSNDLADIRKTTTLSIVQGNNPFGQVDPQKVEVEPLQGREDTRIIPFDQLVQQDSETVPANKPSDFQHQTPSASSVLPAEIPAMQTGMGTPRVAIPSAIHTGLGLEEILLYGRKAQWGDLYIQAGQPFKARIGSLLSDVSTDAIDHARIRVWLDQWNVLAENVHTWTEGVPLLHTISVHGAGRLRTTLCWGPQGPLLSFRFLASNLPTFEVSGLPAFVKDWCGLTQGLVLVAGGACSGRSTTLSILGTVAATERSAQLQTLENPVECLLSLPSGVVVQKQVGLHVTSMEAGLRMVRSEAPDILIIDSLESAEDLLLALEAAHSGALVFASVVGMHVLGVLLRLPEQFPESNQGAVRNLLATCLRGVICQHLVPGKQSGSLHLAVEAVKITPSIASLIRKNDIQQIPAAISALKNQGISLDDSLQNLLDADSISGIEAWNRATDSRRFAAHKPDPYRKGAAQA